MNPARERLGVFGGTFDPPHIGHLVAGLYAFHEISLTRLLFVISNIPWQKVERRSVTPAMDRLAMVSAAVKDHRGFEASKVEIERGGESYTAETLRDMAISDPGSELFLVLGADAAAAIPTWRRAERLADLATVVVVDRPGSAAVDLPGFRVEHVKVPGLEISSTDLRERLGAGRPVDWLVPAAVLSVVQERGLYPGSS